MPSLQSDQELRRVIGLYGPSFQSAQWPPVSTSAGFSGAIVYQFCVEHRKYALRIWPESERSFPKLEALTRLLEDLQRQGISYVAPAIRKPDGAVATLTASNRMVHIEPWLPGCSVSADSCNEKKLEKIMLALARLHLASANHVPKQEHYRWLRPRHSGKSASLEHRFNKLERLLKQGISPEPEIDSPSDKTRRLYQRLQGLFRTQAPLLLEKLRIACLRELPVQPVFRDIWRDHVLFQEDELTGFIDPGAFGTDSVLTDLSRLLGSIAGNDWEKWSEALASYQRIRPLSRQEQNLLGVFDQSNLLLSASGCFQKYIERFSAQDEFSLQQQERLSVRLEEYLARLESYPQRA